MHHDDRSHTPSASGPTRPGDPDTAAPGGPVGHGGLSRRGLMALAGLGTAAAALPVFAAAPASAASAGSTARQSATTASAADGTVPRMLSGDRYPIGMWWPPHPFETNDERYQQMAEAGFTFAIGGNYLNDDVVSRWALGTAERAGLDFIPVDADMTCLTHRFSAGGPADEAFMLSDAEVRSSVQSILGRYPGKAFGGINLYDEPWYGRFGTLAQYVAAVRELAPTALPYINMLPSNDVNYYRNYVQTVRPPMLSFDRYPLVLGADYDAGWFDNLAIVRTVAQEAGIPYWTFIQSIKYANHRMPTPAELRWQIGIALAYGYKGIQYFTYWTPDPARGEAFEPALITVGGERTALWYAAKEVNRALGVVGTEILPLTSESVGVTGNVTPPKGLPSFAPGDWVAGVSGDPVVVGQFTEAPDSASRTLVVTNWSFTSTAKVQLRVAGGISQVTVDAKPGELPAHPAGGTVPLTLEPGAFARITLVRG